MCSTISHLPAFAYGDALPETKLSVPPASVGNLLYFPHIPFSVFP